MFVDYISFIYIYIYINSDILADTFINVYALKKMTFINGKLHWKKKEKKGMMSKYYGFQSLKIRLDTTYFVEN